MGSEFKFFMEWVPAFYAAVSLFRLPFWLVEL